MTECKLIYIPGDGGYKQGLLCVCRGGVGRLHRKHFLSLFPIDQCVALLCLFLEWLNPVEATVPHSTRTITQF